MFSLKEVNYGPTKYVQNAQFAVGFDIENKIEGQ